MNKDFCLFNKYTSINFILVENRLLLRSILFGRKVFVEYETGMEHGRVFLIGKNYLNKLFNRYGANGEILRFVDIKEQEKDGYKEYIVIEKNETILVKTVYTLFNDSATFSVYREVENISEKEIILECVSPFTVKGIMVSEEEKYTLSSEQMFGDPTAQIGARVARAKCERPPYLWTANNTWCSEADFQRRDLEIEGMLCRDKMKRCAKIAVSSNGTQTTNRYLPLGVLEKEGFGYLFFEIEPTGSWSYEIEAGLGDVDDHEIILAITGRTLCDNGWYKTLKPTECYETETVRVVGAQDIDGVLKEMTMVRRHILQSFKNKASDRVIYNIFQHNVFASPTEEKDAKILDYVKEYDIDDYVIDAGWFDNGSTLALGIWDENVGAYPSGVKEIKRKAKERGMQFGLWVELQSYGYFCENQQLLPEYCFFHVNGVRTVCIGRYQLNYAYPEVRAYADGIIKKLVDRYDPSYIKIDYNQTQVAITDEVGESSTETMRKHCEGYLKWYREIQEKYPNIVFETCASGGMFMDAHIASITNVFSVTDQGVYYNCPPIIGNLPLAVLPEQMGIWTIPVSRFEYPNAYDEEVIMNMVNAFFGTMHLCSKLDALNEEQKELIKEGIAYYRSLAEVRKIAVPVLPDGFCRYDAETLSFGIKTDDKLYLSVYNLGDKSKEVLINLQKYDVKTAELAYPKKAKNEYTLRDGEFTCNLSALSARTFEFLLK